MNQAQNNTKGIIFILIGMASFSIQDSLIKFIFNDTALYELYFGRTLVAALLLIIFLKVTSQKLILKTHYPFLTTLRVICFFFGFSSSYNFSQRKSWNKKMARNFYRIFRSNYCFRSKF